MLRAQVTSERWLIVRLANGSEVVTDPEAEEIARDGEQVTLRFYPEQVSAAELISRVAANYPVRDLYVQNPPIEEIIARLYSEAAT